MGTILVVSSVLLWLVVLLNLLLTFALVRRLNTDRRLGDVIGLEAGQVAPEFTAQTLSGETVTRSTYTERKVAFLFVSTHCGPCQEILSHIEQLKYNAALGGVELVLVSGDEIEETRAYIEKQNINLSVLVAPRKNNPFMEDYKSTTTPSYCFVNEQGKVQSAGLPILEWGGWKALADFGTKNDAFISSERR